MSTDILFINLPPYESYYAENVPHLGMLYVMTALRQHGYTVSYMDCASRLVRHKQVVQSIREVAPRMVAFSIDTDNLFSAGNLSKDLKHIFGPELQIMFGGPASQGQAEEIMNRSAADVLVIGEGEYAACEVADCLLRQERSLNDIKGIVYRSTDGLVKTPAREPIQDLDAIPFPNRDFLPNPAAYQASIISGRGCPFRCTFCFEGRMGNKYRHRSPENIVAEMEYLASLSKPVFICINDDTFSADVEHTLRLCRLMRERFRPWDELLWFCEVRVDVIHRHPELVDEMVSAGAARIQIGVESADRDVLRAYKRMNVKPEVVEDAIAKFHRAGIPSIYCGFILGGPHETMETMQRTLDFAKHLLVDVAPGSFECNASFLTPLPGTDIRSRPEQYGIRLLDPDLLTSSNFNFCTAETASLDRSAINNFRCRFVEEVDDQLRALIPGLPRETIEKHVILNRKFNLSTAYYERLGHFPRLAEYFNLVGDDRFESAQSLSDAEILDRFPTRLSGPVQMNGDQITVTRGPTLLNLNGVGSQVFSLCSGKLRTREIVTNLLESFNGSAPNETQLEADVVSFVRHLDQNYAIFLKDF